MMAETDPFPLISVFVIQLPLIDQIKSSLIADGSYSNLDSFAFSRCSRRFLKGSELGGAGDAFCASSAEAVAPAVIEKVSDAVALALRCRRGIDRTTYRVHRGLQPPRFP
jgi:hypothetical protein